MPIRYELGMELALPEPGEPEPGGYTRECFLGTMVSKVALLDGYELRLLLDADVPVDCPHDMVGEMLFMVGEGVGGPLAPAVAEPVIAEADRLGRAGSLPDALSPILIGPALGAKRMVVLPPHCITQIARFDFPFPLEGVALVSAVEIKALLTPELLAIDEVAHLAKLLDFCIRTRVVLSAVVP